MIIKEGGLLEISEWELHYNVVVYNDHPCRHCIKDDIGDIVCPSAVIAKNQGGYDHTAICMQCIIELYNLLEKAE